MSSGNDNLDHAAEFAQLYVQNAPRKPEGPVANGRCHWCDEILDDYARFCDAICRDQYDKHGAPT